MTRGEYLVMHISDLVTYLQTIAEDDATTGQAGTGIETVVRLYGTDIDKLVSNSIGVFMTVPSPTTEQIMQQGMAVIWNWEVHILVNVQASTHEEGLIRALNVLSVIRERLSNPGGGFGDLQPSREPVEIYDNQASYTVAGLNYELQWEI